MKIFSKVFFLSFMTVAIAHSDVNLNSERPRRPSNGTKKVGVTCDGQNLAEMNVTYWQQDGTRTINNYGIFVSVFRDARGIREARALSSPDAVTDYFSRIDENTTRHMADLNSNKSTKVEKASIEEFLKALDPSYESAKRCCPKKPKQDANCNYGYPQNENNFVDPSAPAT